MRERIGLAVGLAAIGFVDEAWDEHDRAAAELAQAGSAPSAVLAQFGEFLKRQGRLVEARHRFEAAAEAARGSLGDPLSCAESLAGLAYCLEALGRGREALRK